MSTNNTKVLAIERKPITRAKAIVGANVTEETNTFTYVGFNRPISMYKANQNLKENEQLSFLPYNALQSVESQQKFKKKTYGLRLQAQRTCSSETSVDIQRIRRRYVLDNMKRTLHNHPCGNLRFYLVENIPKYNKLN
jgi:hypothetical protein